MTLWKWSKTASANANSDATVNWAEGQPPSSVNDSGRAMMAATAKFRDDVSGVIVTEGSDMAYTVVSNQYFDSLAHLDGKVIAFTPHVTNGEAPTLSVDGLAAKPLRAAHGVALQSNVLLAGTPYVALYSNGNGEFVLQGMTANPYGIPLAAGMDYWADTTPGSAYAFPTGQAISRTVYSKLFDLIGTKFGSGDGTTTFNLPDKTGRVSAMKENTATRLTTTYFGGDSTAIGTAGGSESSTLQTTNLPPYTPSGTITNGVISLSSLGGGSNTQFYGRFSTSGAIGIEGGGFFHGLANNLITPQFSQAASTFTGTAQGGTSTPLRTVQPTIVCNYIMRII